MSKALTIIMLDFFVMITIAFFLLQFIQPYEDKTTVSAIRNSAFHLDIMFSKSAFLNSENKTDASMSDLIDVDFFVETTHGILRSEQFQTSRFSEDVQAFYVGSLEDAKSLVVYVRAIRNFSYAASRPTVYIRVTDGKGVAHNATFGTFDSFAPDIIRVPLD